MSVKIIVDSTADMIPEVESRVKIVPLTIHFGENEYISGVDITTKQFYEMLVTSPELPKTSQPTPFAFGEAFEEAVEAGDSVVCITLSSKLSGTYQSATIAAADFPDKVFVVDSQTVAISLGILAEYALRLADQGMEAQVIAEELVRKREDVRLLALVDSLEYLKKGGRVSSTVAFAGGLLNIKPLITVNDGVVQMLGKARGNKQGNSLMMQEMAKSGGMDLSMPVLTGFTGTEDSLYQKFMEEQGAAWESLPGKVPCQMIGSVVGTHVGPGAVAIAYFVSK